MLANDEDNIVLFNQGNRILLDSVAENQESGWNTTPVIQAKHARACCKPGARIQSKNRFLDSKMKH